MFLQDAGKIIPYFDGMPAEQHETHYCKRGIELAEYHLPPEFSPAAHNRSDTVEACCLLRMPVVSVSPHADIRQRR